MVIRAASSPRPTQRSSDWKYGEASRQMVESVEPRTVTDVTPVGQPEGSPPPAVIHSDRAIRAILWVRHRTIGALVPRGRSCCHGLCGGRRVLVNRTSGRSGAY